MATGNVLEASFWLWLHTSLEVYVVKMLTFLFFISFSVCLLQLIASDTSWGHAVKFMIWFQIKASSFSAKDSSAYLKLVYDWFYVLKQMSHIAFKVQNNICYPQGLYSSMIKQEVTRYGFGMRMLFGERSVVSTHYRLNEFHNQAMFIPRLKCCKHIRTELAGSYFLQTTRVMH